MAPVIRACRPCRGRWLYVLNGDAISRQGPRIVDGATAVSAAALDEVRERGGAALSYQGGPPALPGGSRSLTVS